MSDGKIDKLKKFFDSVYIEDSLDVSEIKKDLEASGVNYKSLESRVNDLLAEGRKSVKPKWLVQAHKKRTEIDQSLAKNLEQIRGKYKSPSDLVTAIHAGKFGTSAQQKVMAFFRNQKDGTVSDSDLVSLIEDCELLDLLSSEKKGAK